METLMFRQGARFYIRPIQVLTKIVQVQRSMCVCACRLCVWKRERVRLSPFVFAVLSSNMFYWHDCWGQENDAREANRIKVHYSLSIIFMREDRSNKHSNKCLKSMRLMDTRGSNRHWTCGCIFFTVIPWFAFTRKPQAIGQIFIHGYFSVNCCHFELLFLTVKRRLVSEPASRYSFYRPSTITDNLPLSRDPFLNYW